MSLDVFHKLTMHLAALCVLQRLLERHQQPDLALRVLRRAEPVFLLLAEHQHDIPILIGKRDIMKMQLFRHVFGKIALQKLRVRLSRRA